MPGLGAVDSGLVFYMFFFSLMNYSLSHSVPLTCRLHSELNSYPYLIQTTFGLICLFPSMHSFHTNQQRHQLQRESCSFFMQAHCRFYQVLINVTCLFTLTVTASFNPKWYHSFDPVYMMLLLYFRPVTEKKTPLLRNHSICSGPQRSPFTLFCFLTHAFPMG